MSDLITEKLIKEKKFIRVYRVNKETLGFSKGTLILRFNPIKNKIIDIKDYEKGWPGVILAENIDNVTEFEKIEKLIND